MRAPYGPDVIFREGTQKSSDLTVSSCGAPPNRLRLPLRRQGHVAHQVARPFLFPSPFLSTGVHSRIGGFRSNSVGSLKGSLK